MDDSYKNNKLPINGQLKFLSIYWFIFVVDTYNKRMAFGLSLIFPNVYLTIYYMKVLLLRHLSFSMKCNTLNCFTAYKSFNDGIKTLVRKRE